MQDCLARPVEPVLRVKIYYEGCEAMKLLLLVE